MKQYLTLTTLVVVLAILLFGAGALLLKQHRTLTETQDLLESSHQEIAIWKDKHDKVHAKIAVMETESVQTFLELKTKDSLTTNLQKLVKKYKSKLQSSGNVTTTITLTEYDTIYKTSYEKLLAVLDSIKAQGDASTISLTDSINNPYIQSIFGFRQGNTIFKLSIKDTDSYIIGEERQGWFKPKKPFVEVITDNPYKKVKDMRSYRVAPMKQKHFSIGPGIGYGIDGQVQLGVYINYGIIKF